MGRCIWRGPNYAQCENEAVFDRLYCAQHAVHEADIDQKIKNIAQLAESQKNKKDIWDILHSSGTIISGLLIGFIGIYATTSYNDRQLELQRNVQEQNAEIKRIEVIQKFFSNIYSESPDERRGALIAIEELSGEELAASLAEKIGSVEALTKFTKSENAAIAEKANIALQNEIATDLFEKTIFQIKSPLNEDIYGPNVFILGTGFIISENGYALTVNDIIPKDDEGLESEIKITFHDDPEISFDGDVVGIDQTLKLSFIKFRNRKLEGLKLTDDIADIGDKVQVVGFLSSSENAFVEQAGIIESVDVKGNYIIKNVINNSGLAGSPVINSNGFVFGYVIGANSDGNIIAKQVRNTPSYIQVY